MEAISAIDQFVHIRLDSQPGLSGFGAMLQVARLNHFHAQDFHAAFGLRFQYREDLSHVLVFSAKRKASLITALGVSTSVSDSWEIKPWQPFEGGNPWICMPWHFRACNSCLRVSYHSNLFQMPWITQCPWHRESLIERCRRCNRALLDGFCGSKVLLLCACGYDPVNEAATLVGERRTMREERSAHVGSYLAWSAERRSAGDQLISPEEEDPHGREAMSELLRSGPAQRDRRVATRVHLVERTRREGHLMTREEHEEMRASANGLWPDAPGVAGLPRHFCDGLVQISHNISSGVPDSALSFSANSAKGLEPGRTTVTESSRYEQLFLPTRRKQERLYLDTSILHQTTRRAAANLAWELLNNDPGRLSGDHGSNRLLLNAIQLTVGRGYADGFRHVIGRQNPAIFDKPRSCSGSRIPWVLVIKNQGVADTIKVAWTMRRPRDNTTSPSTRSAKRSKR